MEFIKILDSLKEEHANTSVVRKNGTLILDPIQLDDRVLGRHQLYKPLTDDLIKEWLLNEFNLEFPKEYIEFLKYSNGGGFFRRLMVLTNSGHEIFRTRFDIFGLPRTSPYSRNIDEEEPIDVRRSNFLSRHRKIPNHFLKCALFDEIESKAMIDVFIDTKTHKIYSYESNTKNLKGEWDNLDKCFCDLYNTFLKAPKKQIC